MRITRQDIIGVADSLKMTRPYENAIAYVQMMYDIQADADPTGAWHLYIEDLLYAYQEHEEDCNDMVENVINIVTNNIKAKYISSTVTSGEFIYSVTIREEMLGYILTPYILSKGIQNFLDWDDSPATFGVKLEGDEWVIYELDSVTYNGKDYPVRVLSVTIDDHGDDLEHNYMIAPEQLLIDMEECEGEDATTDQDTEASEVDVDIYHYVLDEVFYNDAKEIAKYYLDTPMTLISENI